MISLLDTVLGRIAILLALVCALAGDTRCSSIPINQKIEEQKKDNEKAKEIAKKYIPVGQLLDTVTGALDDSSQLLHDTNKEREKEKTAKEEAQQDAKEAEAEASTWRWIKRGFWATIIAGGAYLLYRFAGKIPVIGRFFS